jgi:hypothetical protein
VSERPRAQPKVELTRDEGISQHLGSAVIKAEEHTQRRANEKRKREQDSVERGYQSKQSRENGSQYPDPRPRSESQDSGGSEPPVITTGGSTVVFRLPFAPAPRVAAPQWSSRPVSHNAPAPWGAAPERSAHPVVQSI